MCVSPTLSEPFYCNKMVYSAYCTIRLFTVQVHRDLATRGDGETNVSILALKLFLFAMHYRFKQAGAAET